ncbi:hypothetical protein CJF31_00000257 [Rutstroemia sp. NJR-2017a BVV2]|nr:hypothetical protein CJF31_00000257 [Rutstroemia sp. NJR-2017a BVV2]
MVPSLNHSSPSIMDHECEKQQYSPLVFTSLQGKVFQVDLDEIPQLSPTHRRTESVKSLLEVRSSNSPDANGNVVKDEHGLEVGIGGLDESGAESEDKNVTRAEEQSLKDLDRGRSSLASHFIPSQLVEPMSNLSMQLPLPIQNFDGPPAANFDADQVWMIYNEYGELVDAKSVLRPQLSRDMKDVTQIMRLFKKVYHHDFRARMIDVEQVDWESPLDHENNKHAWAERISSWKYEPDISKKNPPSATPEEKRTATVCQDPPRVLEVGCSDGSWCFQLRNAHPDWIIDGIDDTDHWTCMNKDTDLRHGCMDQSLKRSANMKCRDSVLPKIMSQTEVKFKVRNLNCLLNHREPIPRNFYSFIRGRDIFDRTESYKNLLDDIRLDLESCTATLTLIRILQPDGVVEFIEVDARPRNIAACHSLVDKPGDDRTSKAQTGWTDCIADRLERPPHTDELASDVPGWMRRVEERQKATMRPRDGIPAVNLKSWLEGAGFWDVQEHIRRLPIGGTTTTGERLRDFILYRTELEDSIPQLEKHLPPVELDAVKSGNYYLTVHIVTARKPPFPRVGDQLTNSSREEMSDENRDCMSRDEALKKAAAWKRLRYLSSIHYAEGGRRFADG